MAGVEGKIKGMETNASVNYVFTPVAILEKK